ncbi:MAG TPA: enoyl-CoA hydratase/isomerase family protein [Solirubrobacteraceae bacterium]|nr:enoyl-CoA hydratase/isomerase family protein [Solirubrobacteraceae bacterium]
MSLLSIQTAGAVGRLTLSRPDKLNALSPALLGDLIEAARDLDALPEVKVVIVSGEGRAFCAGFDLGAFAAQDAQGDTRATADLGRRMAEAITGMRALTIARVHGHCVGGGLVLAAACDLRVAAADTVFSIPEVELGIPLAWGGIPRLVREIGPAMTKELVLTCRPFTAEEGRALGLLNRVVPPAELGDAVDALAAQLAGRSAFTLTATKTHVNAAAEDLASTAGAVRDADVLLAAVADPESRAAAAQYLRSRGRTS